MPGPLRGSQTLYIAAVLAAVAALVVAARLQQGEPGAPLRRAVPQMASRPAHSPREPRPLMISQSPAPIPPLAASHGEVRAGFPADQSNDIGPITAEEASIYGPATEAPAEQVPGLHRLAPVEVEAEGETQTTPLRATPAVPDEALLPVLRQAAQLNRQAESLARRGAYFVARNLTMQSLRMVAEALDLQTGGGEHTAALASAVTALREAGDFQSRSSEDSTISVPLVVAGHRTPIHRQQNAEGLSAIAAQQQYFNFARQQLVVAAGGQPVASHSLCNLGKLQARMGGSPQLTNLARGVVYEQAALAVDSRNFPAANELGSILTALGEFADARRVLLHSVGTAPNSDGWRHLATVHDRLGETELAAHARKQVELLSGRAGGPLPKVEWVKPEVFAGTAPASSGGPAVQASSGSDQRTADSRPKQKETWISPFGIKR